MFEEHGTVQSCTLVMDKDTNASKGFGFVEMPKPGEAKAAIKLLNGQELDGSKIRVKKAETKPSSESDD
jgi:RNA recognition motif-containing protein